MTRGCALRALRALLVPAVLLLGASALEAQEPMGPVRAPGLVPGDRVLVTSPTLVHWQVEGELLSASADALRIRPAGGGAHVTIPREAVQRLRVSEGRRRATWRGAFIGVIVGFAIGEAIVAGERADGAIDPACGELSCRGWPDRFLWTGIGFGAGSLVGSRFHHERWIDVPAAAR